MEIRLKLKVKDVEIELSREEMKELKDALDELLGAKVEKEYYPVYPYYPYNPPIITYERPLRYWEYYTSPITTNSPVPELPYTVCMTLQ